MEPFPFSYPCFWLIFSSNKNVVKYFFYFVFPFFRSCCGQKHSDIDLISEIPCPKASNQHGTMRLNSSRNFPVLEADVRKGSRKWKVQRKRHTVFQAHQGIICKFTSLVRWPDNFSWCLIVSLTKWSLYFGFTFVLKQQRKSWWNLERL